MRIIFWASISIILYTYVIYPMIIFLISRFYRKRVQAKFVFPTVSIIMSVHNEEKNIENKIQNLLELDYPRARMEILVGSDGSTDGTNKILRDIQGRPAH